MEAADGNSDECQLGKKKEERDEAESGGGGEKKELGHDVPITFVVHRCVVNKQERERGSGK